MERRAFLSTVGLGSIAATAGCLQTVFGTDSETDSEPVLEPPEDRQFNSEEIPYPAHGQALPDFAVPDPLSGKEIDTSTIEKTLLVTGFFATCPEECLNLTTQLAGVQRGTVEDDIADRVALLAITFDPERDDAATLREYGNRMNIDMDAGNWHFLRPQSPERTEEIVEGKLGITYDRLGAGESGRLPGYDFTHLSLTFLRNPDGIVERAYRTDTPDHEQVLADTKTVVDAY